MPPTEAEVIATTQVEMYQGRDAVRSAALSAQVMVAL
jgi:hypothetical protein